MSHKWLAGGMLVLLTACGSIENSKTIPYTVNGRETVLLERTYTVGNETRTTYSVRSQNGSYQQCDPNMAGSCERAARSNAGGKNR